MTRLAVKRWLALLLLPLIVSLACNLPLPSAAEPPSGGPSGESPAVLSSDGSSVGGLSPDEPTPDLSSLPQLDPPSDDPNTLPALEPTQQARLFRYAPSSVELPESLGKTRRQPYFLHTLVSTPGWDFQVQELLRGRPAWELIHSQSQSAPPPPPGKEYVLVWVWTRSKNAAEGYRDIGIFDLYLTGSQGVAYTDSLWDAPAPELYNRDTYSGMEVEGWLDFLIDSTDSDLMLVFDQEETNPAGEAQLTLFFVALEDGASLAPPAELGPNDLGANPAAPVPLGQTAVTQHWQITLLESVRGGPAFNLLKERHENNQAPEAGMEYIAFRARLINNSKQEQAFWINSSHFASRDAIGKVYEAGSIYTDFGKGGNWLQGGLLPGGEMDGWGFIQTPVSEPDPLLIFAPDGLNSAELVYLALHP